MPIAILGVVGLGLGGWLMNEVNTFNSPDKQGGMSPVMATGIALTAAYLTYRVTR